MAEYIERQAVIDALDVLCQEHRYRIPGKRETYSQYNEAWQDALDRAEGVIGNMPSTDIQDKIDNAYMHGYMAAEAKYRDALRHGHWIRHTEQKNIFNGKTIECSECGEKYVVQYIEDEKFCRSCGAKMDGEQNG